MIFSPSLRYSGSLYHISHRVCQHLLTVILEPGLEFCTSTANYSEPVVFELAQLPQQDFCEFFIRRSMLEILPETPVKLGLRDYGNRESDVVETALVWTR